MAEPSNSKIFRPCARVIGYTAPMRIMVANAKGGCGKTTLATNLASYCAEQHQTALIDYDPQGSAMDWLKVRSPHLPHIEGVAAFKKHQPHLSTRTWSLRVAANTTRVVIDTPAGLHGHELSEMLQHTDVLLIPVIPSAIDIRAATGFIRDVMLSRPFRINPRPLAVVANRVRKNTLIYAKLERFLQSLKIPFITSLRDTQFYVRASEHGLGIVDLDDARERDGDDWRPLLNWLDSTAQQLVAANDGADTLSSAASPQDS
ncbi:partition-related protein [Bacterioplanes sanyensis]|uniref:Partition-related protein n=1 Tax=Bacterioplanes sanyensis TaxID=1249553 RepID=A0A222FGD7_9GAMM|nr:ParA family protein [Bacterioplanes sanyensis]ASP37799.1 partition-related protein [Bacterioplanes sanyensis]